MSRVVQKPGFCDNTHYRRKTPEKPGFFDFRVAQKPGFCDNTDYRRKNPEKPGFFSFDENPDKSMLMEIIGCVGAGLCR
ncbi:hypothetical protein [Microcoleus sp. herbarium14]|uniref:hypothetical protein n=1 Tax=Microcoleus sp. herbarium14 TaxID=3055439 RepID=UPI002FCED05F